MTKKRIVKDYEALPEEVIQQVKINYPEGFAEYLISYNNAQGKKVSALPFETDEIYYLIRMTVKEAEQIIEDDDDYDDDGVLRDDFEDDIEEAYDGAEDPDEDVENLVDETTED